MPSRTRSANLRALSANPIDLIIKVPDDTLARRAKLLAFEKFRLELRQGSRPVQTKCGFSKPGLP